MAHAPSVLRGARLPGSRGYQGIVRRYCFGDVSAHYRRRRAPGVDRRARVDPVGNGGITPAVTTSGEPPAPSPSGPARPARGQSTAAQPAAQGIGQEPATEERGQKLLVIYGALMLAL